MYIHSLSFDTTNKQFVISFLSLEIQYLFTLSRLDLLNDYWWLGDFAIYLKETSYLINFKHSYHTIMLQGSFWVQIQPQWINITRNIQIWTQICLISYSFISKDCCLLFTYFSVSTLILVEFFMWAY